MMLIDILGKKKKWYPVILLAAVLLAGILVAAVQIQHKNPLNPDKPILLTIWHYRVGSAKTAFDELLEKFNDTVGAENGIVVEGYSAGNIDLLYESLVNSIEGKSGSEPVPDIFAAYNTHAY